LWAAGREVGIPEHLVAWAMVIEAIDRLALRHGSAAMARMLCNLADAVLDARCSSRDTLQ
jgi:hypothetical protein